MGLKAKSICAVEPNLISTPGRVEELIISSLNKSTQTKPPIRMGIEQEFFIEKLDHTKVEMPDSQRFMHELSGLPGWRLFPEPGNSKLLSRVSYEVKGVGYHSLKYEHPPHMLEIAFAPYSNLHDLYQAIEKVLADLKLAAERSELNLNFGSSIEAPIMNWNEVNQFSSKYQALAATREKMVESHEKNESWVHFTTYTAATQFHIGGTAWWLKNGALVEKLYRSELLTGRNAYSLLGFQSDEIQTAFQKRWAGYFKVFKKMSLVGFPALPTWTVQNWVQEFCKSSLVVTEENPFFGKDLNSVGADLSDDLLAKLIHSVRDLQVVKPKLIGTVEMRADPALTTPKQIIRQAALRLGVFEYCLSDAPSVLAHLSFSEVRERWKSGLVIDGIESHLNDQLECAIEALKKRGKGEESLL